MRALKAIAARRELLPGTSPELCQALHLLTRDGDLNADSRRKLKQVNHLIGLLTPALDDILERFADPVIADCGAGKGYLAFIVYELFFSKRESGTLWCIESRPELVQAGSRLAQSLGFERLKFIEGSIEAAAINPGLPPRLHLVTALHACDTATDDALLLGTARNADHIAVVPCCQAEVARQLDKAHALPVMASLFDHPWHRREFGSHLTNVLRALVLESLGYSVTVTELTGWEHALKNELILARKVGTGRASVKERLRELLGATGVRPKLVRSLEPLL